ncbi:PREDICTED: uncharacterized protein LOC105364856 [Ceratosolen solmsi marchali]|uniref:Uncharacterized protein LOC105364856 n=1 Tax=Ceratosolen solmsi marchali TaxID=326594 RepID=A0AAJ6YNB5_9HYME|nr:PREDICTED: uncharacterized protein LOC105364856 [Ceratosolen solmsi marchali]
MEHSIKKLNVDATSNEKQVDINKVHKQQIRHVLTYDVLRIIFQHLSAKDLLKVSHICRSWRDAANNEAASRKAPECIFKKFQIIDKENLEDSYNATLLGNELRVKPCFGLVCIKIQEDNEWVLKGCYCKNLPSKCSTFILGGYDITIDDIKIENKFGMGVCAFLPEIPKLNHKIFHVDINSFKDVSKINMKSHMVYIIQNL